MKEFFKTYKDKLLLGIIFISYVFLLINMNYIYNGVSKFLGLLTPFVYGFIIAYLINPLVNCIENFKLTKKIKKVENRHILSMVLSYILLISMLVVFFIFVIPDIWNSAGQIIKDIPNLIPTFENFIAEKFPNGLPFVNEDLELVELFKENLQKIIDFFANNWSGYASKAIDITKSVSTTVINIILGVIISIYMLVQKDNFIRQSKKTLFALTKEKYYNQITDVLSRLHTSVSNFISAKLLDSFILGVLCFVGLLFMGVGHKLPIATIIGIGNLIPYVGSFLGTIPCAIMILAESPIMAIVFVVYVLILQWVDNNIISPKLMGDSMGINAFWVLFAVIIMTGLFGFTGMLIGVPIFAVIYALVREFIEAKLKEKTKSNTETQENTN